MALDVRPRSLGITYPHHRTTRENQRHITGTIWEALTILQTGNRTGKPGSQPTRGQRPGRTPMRSKGKRGGAVFCRKRSIETRAVKPDDWEEDRSAQARSRQVDCDQIRDLR